MFRVQSEVAEHRWAMKLEGKASEVERIRAEVDVLLTAAKRMKDQGSRQ